jgi:hypothetical protein
MQERKPDDYSRQMRVWRQSGCSARNLDVAESVRERLYSIGPVAHMRTQRTKNEGASGARM